jgi:NADPH-dependent 7-cyano-7-deazaguanine reductase QueF-like protein
MDIRNSSKNDMNQIFELYALATEYMKSKNQVAWPEFSREMVSTEIKESRQWKLLIDVFGLPH